MVTAKPDPCALDRCVLCRCCNPEWSERVAKSRTVFHYEKGQDIFTEGKVVQGLYFIYSGAVKVHQSWGPGNEFILRFAVSGDVLGHRALVSGADSPISATALERTTLCHLDNTFLGATIKANPSFAHMMMQLYATELQKAEKRMRDLAMMPVKSRVAETLFVIREVLGSDAEGYFRIPVTRIDIAGYAGTTYEAVFRLLTAWARDGLVTIAGKKIRINEEEKLRALIQYFTL
ncbi:MAG TPA: Crp/Fnr family transcriptional regulator [Puia sp.]|nr:Crp/Fnr family transcriptional regulator [Puia sp.]